MCDPLPASGECMELAARPDGSIVLLNAPATKACHARQRQLPHRGPARRRHRAGSHGAGARGAAQGRGVDARPEAALHRGAGGRRPLSRHRHVDAGIHDQAVRAGRRHPARRLRAAAHPLSRQYRDHAAGRAALHLRPLCRRAAVPADPEHPEPDRRRRRARHRSGGDPRIDRRPVRLHGQGRGDRHRGARDPADHAQDLGAAVRFLVPPDAAAQGARLPRPAHLRRQGQRVQGLCLLPPAVRRMRRALSRRSRPTVSTSMPARPCWCGGRGISTSW